MLISAVLLLVLTQHKHFGPFSLYTFCLHCCLQTIILFFGGQIEILQCIYFVCVFSVHPTFNIRADILGLVFLLFSSLFSFIFICDFFTMGFRAVFNGGSHKIALRSLFDTIRYETYECMFSLFDRLTFKTLRHHYVMKKASEICI